MEREANGVEVAVDRFGDGGGRRYNEDDGSRRLRMDIIRVPESLELLSRGESLSMKVSKCWLA